MHLKKIVLACTAALALPIAAHAVPPSGPYDTVGALPLFLSGASAPDNFLVQIMTSLLKPGFYQYTAGNNYRLFLGETRSDQTPPNQKILFVKRSEGGSVFGVIPITLNSPIRTMILNPSVCPTPAIPGGPPVGCNTSGPNSAIASTALADFGISDVAPFMFTAPFNVPPYFPPGDPSNLTIRGGNTLMMGMAVTKDVADTLEISKTDYHSMFIKAITDWNTIGAGINTAIDKKTNVVVCSRVPGGQASHNWYYNQFPCAVNTAPARMTDSAGYSAISFGTGDGSSAANAIGIDVTAGYTVIENSGSGDVRTCLRSAALNLPYTFQDEAGLFHRANFDTIPPGHTSQAIGWRAIGKLSLDSQVNISTTAANGGAESAWFFRPLLDGHSNGRFYSGNQSCLVGASLLAPGKVPIGGTPALGTCPNRATLRTGKYDFAAEVTIQYRTGTLNPARQAFVDAFIARVSAPAFQTLWTMTLPNPPTFVPDGTNAVSFASRQINQCGPLARGTF